MPEDVAAHQTWLTAPSSTSAGSMCAPPESAGEGEHQHLKATLDTGQELSVAHRLAHDGLR